MKIVIAILLVALAGACTVRDQAYYNAGPTGVGTAVQDLGNGWYRIAGNGPRRSTEEAVRETLPAVLHAMMVRSAQLSVEKSKDAFLLGTIAPLKVQRTNRYGANLGQWADVTMDVKPVLGTDPDEGKRKFSAARILSDGAQGIVMPKVPN